MQNAAYILLCCLFGPLLAAQQEGFRRVAHFGVTDGLSQGSVYSMLEDSRGFMWFTSYEGLNRFDGHNFSVYYPDSGDSTSLRGSVPLGLVEDPYGDIWVGTESCLNRYRRRSNDFTAIYATDPNGDPIRSVHYPFYADSNEVWYTNEVEGIVAYDFRQQAKRMLSDRFHYRWTSAVVNSTLRGSDGRIWIRDVTGLAALDPETGATTRFFSDHPENVLGPELGLVCHLPNPDGSLWLGLTGGIIRLWPVEQRWQYYPVDTLATVADIRQAADGLLYLGTEDSGLYLYEPGRGVVEHLSPANSGLSGLSTATLYLTDQELLWINVDPVGLNLVYPPRRGFRRYGKRFFEPYDFSSAGIRCFAPAPDGTIWVGTQEDGVFVFDPRRERIIRHLRARDTNGLTENHASALHWDRLGRLWVGTHQGGFYSNDGGQSFRRIRTPIDSMINEPAGLIWDFLSMPDGRLLLATNAGIWQVPPGTTRAYPLDTLRELTTGDIEQFGRWLLIPDYHQGFRALDYEHWVATEGRGYRVRRPLDHYNIKHFVPEGDSLLWLGTTSGVLKTRPTPNMDSLQILRRYTKRDGLPSDYIYGLLRDTSGKFWLSSNRGIARLDPRTDRITVYGPEDNVQGNEFNTNSYLATEHHTLYFGGTQGFNHFTPPLDSNTYIPRIQITELLINGAPAQLDRYIGERQGIELAFAENTFSLRFAAIDYWSNGDNRYRVRLADYDADWIELREGEIRYTRVPWGQYTFEILASNSDGTWTPTPTRLAVTIAPPPALSAPALAAYALLALFLLGLIYRQRRNRRQQREQLARERAETERIKELEAFKSRFYTNISHDFRTPLSVIQGIASRLTRSNGIALSEGVALITHQSRQLLQLVDQLLDISRLESGHLQPTLVCVDLVPLLRSWLDNYRLPASDRSLHLLFNSPSEVLKADCDVRLLRHIVDNLLANAVKFTPEGGQVTLSLSVTPAHRIFIAVADTGPGIAPEQAEHIFQRFFRGSEREAGTGLGLAFARELAQLLDAELRLLPSAAAGSTFELSFAHTHVAPPLAAAPAASPEQRMREASARPFFREHAPHVLLVEDDAGMRTYLQSWLADRYRVSVARTAAAAWELLQTTGVDLVLSDVMLEEEDAGFTLCRRIKNDTRWGALPVILLTARADRPSRYAGLSHRADAYLAKPVDETELEIRLRELLSLRDQLADWYAERALERLVDELRLSPDNQAILDRLHAGLRDRLSDRHLKAQDLADLAGKSKTVFNEWLKTCTGYTPAQYLRHLRLELAHQLVVHSDETVDTIAAQTGFSDGSYLTKKYKERFGYTPGQVRSEA